MTDASSEDQKRDWSEARRAGWRGIGTSTAFRLAVLAFVIYQLNLRSISSADTFSLRYLPISILSEANADLDEFPFLLDQRYGKPLPYYLQYHRGHYLSTPPIGVALLAMPVYAVPVWLGLTGDSPATPPPGHRLSRTEIVGTLLSKISASMLIAISVALVYLALREVLDATGARWIALAYAFATSSWAVSSQGLWQTTGSQATLAGAFLALLVARRTNTRAMVALAGALLALAVVCRPTAIIFALVLTVYVVRAHREHVRAYLPTPAILAGLLIAYNVYYFGTIKGGYEGNYAGHLLSWDHVSTALRGLLVSPNRGILVFSPVLLPAFAGIGIALHRSAVTLFKYLAVGVLLSIGFYSTLVQWHGQFSYSYRYLVDQLPALALLAAPTWGWLTARLWRRVAIGGLATFSVFLQIVGVVYYPCGWYRATLDDPTAIARFFDWNDLEVVQCLKAGPVEPDGLRVLRGLTTRDAGR